jgi:hypothetical protein
MQDDIAGSVVKALKISIMKADVPRAAPIANSEAHTVPTGIVPRQVLQQEEGLPINTYWSSACSIDGQLRGNPRLDITARLQTADHDV